MCPTSITHNLPESGVFSTETMLMYWIGILHYKKTGSSPLKKEKSQLVFVFIKISPCGKKMAWIQNWDQHISPCNCVFCSFFKMLGPIILCYTNKTILGHCRCQYVISLAFLGQILKFCHNPGRKGILDKIWVSCPGLPAWSQVTLHSGWLLYS